MDKRSWIFFFFVLSATLLMNQYFSPKISLEHQQKTHVEKTRKHLQDKQAAHSPSHEDLSLLQIDGPENGKYLGVEIEGNFLTISTKEPMPKTLSMGNALGAIAFPNKTIEPVIYRTNDKKVDVYSLNLQEDKLFYLAYQDEETKAPTIACATNTKNEIVTSKEVRQNAFVFDEDHHLIGIFEGKSQKIHSFSSYFRLTNQVNLLSITNETYYVLENPYQMLVFSSKGGSLAEINLPFFSDKNQDSVVKPLYFDRIIEQKYPENAQFPERPYFVSENGSIIEKQPTVGSYYPLLRRDLLTPSGEVERSFDPKYYCCALREEGGDPEIYQVTRFEKNLIEFTAFGARRTIIKRYRLPENPKELPYVFFLTVEVEGDTTGLFLESGVPDVELISGYFSPALKYLVTRNGTTNIQQLSLPKAQQEEPLSSLSNQKPEWIVNSNGFLGVILDPLNGPASGLKATAISGEKIPTRLSLISSQYGLYPAEKYPGYSMQLPFPKNAPAEFRIFAGPFESDTLQTIDQTVQKNKGVSPDYTKAQSSHGWFSFISAPFSKFLFLLMRFFHTITSSWGLSILLLTLTMRILLYPLNAWSFKAGQRSQEVMPALKKIQEKYKKNPEKLQLETMKLYKETGYNPFMGCFPAFIQMPFLLGLFDLLKSSFDLRGASFIPGWIDNLAAPDVLFSWGYRLFYFGTSFHLLPVIFAFVTLAQQKLTFRWSGASQQPLTEQQRQQQAIGNGMVIVLSIAVYHFPSGLNIYWIFSTCLGILQQYIMHKRKGVKKESQTTLQVKK
ncbi:MAG: membrane protein insertase YidC [Chlamydiota bacterium]